MKTAKNTPWIWTPDLFPERNAFVRFRKSFNAAKETRATLRISADSRYWLWLNGELLGSGPVRSWVNHWKFDQYEVTLKPGKNTLAVLVNSWGTGNFQYLVAAPGLWLELSGEAAPIVTTGRGWKCSESPAHVSNVPRVSVQEWFEEQFDARADEPWLTENFNDKAWSDAVQVPPPHPSLEPSGIALLTEERVYPQRIVRAEQVSSPSQTWTLDLHRQVFPGDVGSELMKLRGFITTQIWSDKAQKIELIRPHHHSGEIKLNGKVYPALAGGLITDEQMQPVPLKAGWNQLLVSYPDTNANDCGYVHMAQFVLTVRASAPLVWSATGKKGGPAWAFVGPFEFTQAQRERIRADRDFPRLTIAEPTHPEASAEAFEKLYADGGQSIDIPALPYFAPFSDEYVLNNDAFAFAWGDRVTAPLAIENAQALLSGNAEWALIPAPAKGDKGDAVRVLVDYGREVVGAHEFEIEAAEGTVVDFFNFEFIQPDGRENYAEGMNNSLRYICKGGRQRYRSLQRRGFQYSYIIFRNISGPVRLRSADVHFISYPQTHQGWFTCDDFKLNEIWKVGAHTLRCCAEDTYTDCPTYEQTHWVGDSRNEALIDWVINGDPRLWFRCAEQIGQSLELDFADITASQVPSSWSNILSTWSFLWMRSCREYLLWTGDYAGSAKLLKWVIRNVDGVERHINADGLFELQSWNLFDWAEMDTPDQGVITHLNCFAVVALRECAEMARWLKNPKAATRFERLAKSIETAINTHLWDAEKRAYIDCIHADGTKSAVLSQQTATVALISGVAQGEREKRCREIIHNPPKGFVKAGSPFFEFFLLEVLKLENKDRAFLDVIRRDWGFMVEQGASTFWEMWSQRHGRLTRSHCHGWSAAPTFFLSNTVLGVEPLKPGFAEVRIAPKLGDLQFVRGAMPTPHGLIEVSARRKGSQVEVSYKVPKGVRVKK